MEILLAVGAVALILGLVYNIEIFETGLVGLWESFVGFWRYVAQLGRDGR
jgi:hypothetical protein